MKTVILRCLSRLRCITNQKMQNYIMFFVIIQASIVLIIALLNSFKECNNDGGFHEFDEHPMIHEDLSWLISHPYFRYNTQEEPTDSHQSCFLQQFDPFHPSLVKYLRKTKPVTCNAQISLTYIDDHGMLRFHEENLKKSGRSIHTIRCRYAEVIRLPKNGEDMHRFNISKKFLNPVNVSHTDFVATYCYNLLGLRIYYDVHAHIRDFPNDNPKDSIPKGKYNVMFLGMDSVSRLNAMRQLPKTYSYLKNGLGAFILRGYHKVGVNTFPNLASLLTGYHPYAKPPVYFPIEKEGKPHDTWPFMWKNFSKEGYRTLFSEDDPIYNAFHYMSGGFLKQPTDHYARTFWTAAKAIDATLASREFCFGDQLEHRLVLDYANRLVEKLHKKVPFWSFSFLTKVSHSRVNNVGLVDNDIYNFISNLANSSIFNDTIFLFFSDHGQRFHPIRKTYIGSVEDKMPLMTVLLPKDFHESHPEAVKAFHTNQMRLTTPFDVYCTLMDILKLIVDKNHHLGNFQTKSGRSLLSDIPRNRTCFNAGVEDQFCTCSEEKKISISEDYIQKGASLLVDKINAIIDADKVNSKNCAKLSLSEIVEARIIKQQTSSNSHSRVKIVFKTEPSQGVFEGNIYINEDTKEIVEISSDMERINKYGNQADCVVNNQSLRIFCYCK